MGNCCILKCSTRTKKGIFLRRFPKNEELREKWISNIGRPNWTPTIHSLVCEKHFATSMWEKPRIDGKRKLKEFAYPTLFLHSDVEERDNEPINPLEFFPGDLDDLPSRKIAIDLDDISSESLQESVVTEKVNAINGATSTVHSDEKYIALEKKIQKLNGMLEKEIKSKQIMRRTIDSLKKRLARANKKNHSKEESIKKVLNEHETII